MLPCGGGTFQVRARRSGSARAPSPVRQGIIQKQRSLQVCSVTLAKPSFPCLVLQQVPSDHLRCLLVGGEEMQVGLARQVHQVSQAAVVQAHPGLGLRVELDDLVGRLQVEGVISRGQQDQPGFVAVGGFERLDAGHVGLEADDVFSRKAQPRRAGPGAGPPARSWFQDGRHAGA